MHKTKMIYSLTLNPSLDYLMDLDDFSLGRTNRSKKEFINVGGKGINVSILLKNLGLDTKVLGFVGGFTGQEIARRLEKKGLLTDFIQLDQGLSRINVKLRGREESEINGAGPSLEEDKLYSLYDQLDQLEEGSILVLSGNLIKGLDQDFYGSVMKKLSSKDVEIVVDTSGESLVASLDYGPLLVKPNRDELEEIFACQLEGLEDIKKYARELQKLGARNVIVSLGGQGAYFLSEEGEDYFHSALEGDLVSAVGAGDSMVAGFIYAYVKDFNFIDRCNFSLAAASATAFSRGIATREDILKLYERIG